MRRYLYVAFLGELRLFEKALGVFSVMASHVFKVFASTKTYVALYSEQTPECVADVCGCWLRKWKFVEHSLMVNVYFCLVRPRPLCVDCPPKIYITELHFSITNVLKRRSDEALEL